MTKMASPFLPTLDLNDPTIFNRICSGELKLRTGQWLRQNGRKGQFIALVGSVPHVSWLKDDVEGFTKRTERFSRATYYHKRASVNPVMAVLTAPPSVTLARIKQVFRSSFKNPNDAMVIYG